MQLFNIQDESKKSKKGGNNFWIREIDQNLREEIKTAIISNLACKDNPVRNSVAALIAVIASIELPLSLWDQLLPNLCTNAENDDNYIRMSSLKTLGYICEEVNPNTISNV